MLRRPLLALVLALLLTACDSGHAGGDDDDTAPGDTVHPADTGADDADDAATDASETSSDVPDLSPDTAGDAHELGDDTAPPQDLVDTMPPQPQAVPMFVAQGHVGRTVLSCDGGRSWVADRAYDAEGDADVCGVVAPVVCYGGDGTGCAYRDHDGSCAEPAAECDCDHHPGAGNGIAYGDGWFVATWGWGPPGGVRRSRDGVAWERVLDGTRFGGIAYGDGVFVAADRAPMRSVDGGATWQPGGEADLRAPDGETVWNVRALGFAEGRFVMTGESGAGRDVLLSSDGGASWWRPTSLPASCAAGVRNVVGGNGAIVIAQRSGALCVSRDGGVTFEVAQAGVELSAGVLFTGSAFEGFGGGAKVTSVDGTSWSAQPLSPAGLELGQVARDPDSGSYVGVLGGWQNWYARQRFYRSADGVVWEELAADAYTGGHPIRAVVFGAGAPSAVCAPP